MKLFNTREMLDDTLHIMENGFYVKDGREIKLKLSLDDMKKITVYLPEDVKKNANMPDFNPPCASEKCEYSCENADSYTIAMRAAENPSSHDKDSAGVLVLNMANPVNPGGGVRRGAMAQEEDLCRKSSLLLSLESSEAKKYYEYNKSLHTNLSSGALMITPRVEIIKDENGELLDDTVIVSVLTFAAPYIAWGLEGMSEDEYRAMLFERITDMLKCVAYLGYKHLVLGAWGCGAFHNDAHVMSDIFRKALKELNYNGHSDKDLFTRIDFAVLDRSRRGYNFNEFFRNFGDGNFYRD